MPMRCTLRIIRVVIVAATSLTVAQLAFAQDRDAVRDPATYVAHLRERGLIVQSLQPQLQNIARVLASYAGSWPTTQVNGAYDHRAVNIYLVKTKTGGGADPSGLTERAGGTLLAFPREQLIIVDADYLAEVKAAAAIYWQSVQRRDGSVKTYDAMAIAKIEGPDRAVRSRIGAGTDWRSGTNELFEGAAALLLAHEMGHLALGLDPTLEAWVSRPRGLQGPDRDRFWGCQQLVSANIEQTRRQEAAADLYAAKLLAKIPHPSPPTRLLYEHGALFLRNAEMGMVVAMLTAISPRGPMVRELMAQRISPEVLRGMAETLSRDVGMIETVFPSTHPSSTDRILSLYEVFAETPQSAYYGEQTARQDSAMWQTLIQLMCSSIGAPR
jgi:hypothetical protein